jgi:murein DD-endopeptidase MepM/ murein hydrolase activator NlpD
MVFDTTWDLAGALTVLYGHAGIRADIAAFSNTSVRSDGVAVRTYGGETTYPYGRVVVYDFHDRAAHALDTAAEAQAYFAAPGRAAEPDCPLARHGFGVPIFGKPLRIGLARRL